MDAVIRVSVIRREGRKYFECQWLDPVTGLKKTRSTKTTVRRDAERFAARLESELLEEKATVRVIAWKEFKTIYEQAVYPGQSLKTRQTTKSTLNAIESHINPARLSSIGSPQVQAFAAAVRGGGGEEDPKSEFTVKRHLTELRKMLRWAQRNGYLKNVPQIDVPRKLSGMKGRPITAEEFERMLTAVDSCFPDKDAEAWKFSLRGLWWSGLRLGEAERLHWTDDTNLCVELPITGTRDLPMFRIQSHAEKGRQFRMLPMAPEFAELLYSVPVDSRKGLVFGFPPMKGVGRPGVDWISRLICTIGEKAKVKVSESGKRVKFASAHDLRRAFGFRWSQMVLPPVLMEMMRHASIQTTQQFYVGRNAQASARQIWEAYQHKHPNAQSGNTSGNTRKNQASETASESTPAA